MGRTTIWRMMREGRFPQSRRIGKVAKAWLEDEVEEWIKKCAITDCSKELPLKSGGNHRATAR
ncbi:MAG: helix-turn-helix transcriptional regulator [Pyrinomonadaceae bacterium]